jgi:AraC-like DNA-binding protein
MLPLDLSNSALGWWNPEMSSSLFMTGYLALLGLLLVFIGLVGQVLPGARWLVLRLDRLLLGLAAAVLLVLGWVLYFRAHPFGLGIVLPLLAGLGWWVLRMAGLRTSYRLGRTVRVVLGKAPVWLANERRPLPAAWTMPEVVKGRPEPGANVVLLISQVAGLMRESALRASPAEQALMRCNARRLLGLSNQLLDMGRRELEAGLNPQVGATASMKLPDDASMLPGREVSRPALNPATPLLPPDSSIAPADEVFLARARSVVEQHLGDADFGVGEFASALAVSRVQLYRRLKGLTDQAPTDFVRILRLRRAAQLLSSQAGNVAEVAYAVGFNNLSYFSKCFRELHGHAPSVHFSQVAPPILV